MDRDSDHENQNFLPQDPEQKLTADYQDLETTIRNLQRWLIALSILLALAAVTLLLSLDNAYRSLHRHSGLPPSPIPNIPLHLVTFERNTSFAAPSTPETDQAWATLAPKGDGFILLPNSTRDAYNLPLGKPTAHGDVYDITVFHQLHCLSSIRAYLSTLQASIGRENQAEVMEVLLEPKREHVGHCFDYLRQGLMCAGDMTVEWPRTEADGRRFAVDGWGVSHWCRDWDAIMEWMGENSVANWS